MKTIQNAVVALIIGLCLSVLATLAQAQETEILVGVATLDVEVTFGHTDVCTRVTPSTLQCTRFEKGKATKVQTCEVTKGGLKCSE